MCLLVGKISQAQRKTTAKILRYKMTGLFEKVQVASLAKQTEWREAGRAAREQGSEHGGPYGMSGFCSEMGSHWKTFSRSVIQFDRIFYRIPLPSVWIIEQGGKSRRRRMTESQTSIMVSKKWFYPETLYPENILKVKSIGFADNLNVG